MIQRGTVTRVAGGYVYVEIPARSPGYEFRCQHVTGYTDPAPLPPVGARVLVVAVNADVDDLVVVGRLLP